MIPLGLLTALALKCGGSPAPTGIDSSKPALTWQVESGDRGERQTAWEVQAATSLDELLAGKANLWDSGRVASDATDGIAYGGAPLQSSEAVYWRVRVWGLDGQPSAWTPPSHWLMGLLAASDWKGVWIAAPDLTESLFLRREFTVRPGLKRAVIHLSGLGQFELHLNGSTVDLGFLNPGWTTYDKTVLYDTADVTGLLHPGRNAAGLVLGDGMYDVVRRNRYVKFTGFEGPLRAIVHLRLEYDDGTVGYVGSDSNWRTHAGPITGGGIYSGEDEDARLEAPGWDRPGFDDRNWLPAVELLPLHGQLMGASVSADPLGEFERHRPIGAQRFPDGSVVYDLGQNCAQLPRIEVTGPAGSRVRLTPAEIVNPGGTINPATMGELPRTGYSWWTYTKATDRLEAWQPRFSYSGFRYLKAEFFPAETGGPLPGLQSVEGIVVHSVAPPAGEFAASNPLMGRIDELVRWAQVSNMVSLFTDCPHRERLGWLEQDHLNGPSLRYDFDANRIFAKVTHDMADAQHDDGLMPEIAPEYLAFEPPFNTAAEWGSAFFLVPWQQYEFTGETDLLRRYYEPMTRYFGYLESQAHGNILSQGLGDWFDFGPHPPWFAQLTPPAVTATAFFYRNARVLADAAALLGRPADAERYAARAAAIRATFNRRFFHPAAGDYGDPSLLNVSNGAGRTIVIQYPPTSQCADAMALVFGLAEPADRARVLDALVRDVEQHGGAMTAGDVGFRFLLQALANGGRSDVVYRMIDQDRTPGYAYQLKKGATALTESWDANDHSSHDHFMLGQIVEWFYRDLAGIAPDPAAPGFRRIILRPQPVGDLTWAQARYDSIRGPIRVRWDVGPGTFRLRASIPANTTATVYVPGVGQVTESGRPAAQSPGVRFLRRERGAAVFAVESGSYDFLATGYAGSP